MKQVLHNLRSGETALVDTPKPICQRGQLIISTCYSLISGGTERSLVEFGQANLIAKAQARPDKVQQVFAKLKTDGLLPTMEAVFSRLDEPLPLGYCNSGTVLEVGEGVTEFSVGDRVVSNGPHAEIVSVPKNLCAKIPDSVSDDEAVFTVIASIALQGVRLAEPTLGERVVVLGLGLIGLLTVQLLQANGCKVLGVDFNAEKLALAKDIGAQVVDLSVGEDPIMAGLRFSEGIGVDKVLVTAATDSSDPIRQAAQMSRKRGKIVLVGVTGLDLKREDFYEKELSFQVSCSYGPGRYDSFYEELGHDYPIGFVRWTEQRNFKAILELMKDEKIEVKRLISERIPFDKAPNAYEMLLTDKSLLGVLLTYRDIKSSEQTIQIKSNGGLENGKHKTTTPVIGMIGAGNFSTRVLIPALKKTDAILHTIASAGGISAVVAGKKFGFVNATTDYETIINNPKINTIFIATRHNLHAEMVEKGLKAGKHIFVEKPLSIDKEGLERIKAARKVDQETHLMVGFNRRFSPLSVKMRDLLTTRTQPMTLIYTVNAGAIPAEHWTQDPKIGGGRIIGEGCHFIDLLRFFVGAPIININAQMVGNAPGIKVRGDKMTILLEFGDGSIGTVHYFSNGSKNFPKERIEVFSEERILTIDNFKVMKGYNWPGFNRMRLARQDKGHDFEVSSFIDCVGRGGAALIPWIEIEEVTLAAIAAVQNAQHKNKISI